MNFQPRFDRGIYRGCKWCGGKGCLACPGEADKEYHRQFPDGPKPILTIPTTAFDHNDPGAIEKLIAHALGEIDRTQPQ